MDIDPHLGAIRSLVNARLEELIHDDPRRPAQLTDAMRHCLLGPGKRLRAIVTMLAAEAVGGQSEAALEPACAIEMVHSASLILDDLPCMDDASLRRGRATCHLVYGEDVAVLSAFALLNRAFSVIANARDIEPSVRVELTLLLSNVVGDDGLINGQVRDLYPGPSSNGTLVERVAGQKTAALFAACAESGAMVTGATKDDVASIRAFAWNLGLAFQALDDLTDLTASVSDAGKDVRADGHKNTFVSEFGPAGAREKAASYVSVSLSALQPLGDRAEALRRMGSRLVQSNAERTAPR